MNIRDLREKAQLSQVDAAKKLDVDQASISNWERGVYKPHSKYYKKLSKLYGVSPMDIAEALNNPK